MIISSRKRQPHRRPIPPKSPRPPRPEPDFNEDPIMTAAVALIGRTGAKSFQLRYSDDEEPVIWMAVGIYDDHKGGTAAEVGAAITPVDAAFRLCEKLVDGGQCTHCKRPTGITADFDPVPLSDAICWYQFDPELKIFRRSCE